MRIRFTRTIMLDVYYFDGEDVIHEIHTFSRGEVCPVAELVEIDEDSLVVDLCRVGCVEIPNDAWTWVGARTRPHPSIFLAN